MQGSDNYYVHQFLGAEKLLSKTRDVLYNKKEDDNDLYDILKQQKGQENVYHICTDLNAVLAKIQQSEKGYPLARMIEMFADWTTIFASTVGRNYEKNDLSSKKIREHLVYVYQHLDTIRENLRSHIDKNQ